jgi:hypothetical protein
MSANKFMNRSTLGVVIVVLVVIGIGGYFVAKSGTATGIVNFGKEAGPPTEKEVSDLYEKAYATCIPVQEWNAKVLSLGGSPVNDHPCTKMTGTGDTISIKACEVWINGKYKCDNQRNVADDHFVSFRKTDGKLTAQSQYQTSEFLFGKGH